MNILHIYKDYHPVLGGIENHVRVLAEGQSAAGHGVTVLCCAPTGPTLERREQGVRVVRAARLATWRSMPLSPALVAQARRLPADIVHVHAPFPLGDWAALRRPPGAALVVTHHADVVRQRLLLRGYAPMLRRFLRRVDRIIVTSLAYARTSPWLAPHADKWRAVPLGVDTAHFTPEGPRADPAAALLFVGRLRYYKGLDTLLHAMRQLGEEVRLDVVGEGRMAAAWRALAQELGLAVRVRFLGDLDEAELPARYRGAQLFVLPANCRAEAFGTVLLEALACGLPCVTTEVGSGTSWVVQDGLCGRVVPPGDPTALADALRTLLADAATRRRYAGAARPRVEANFTLPRMLAGVEAVYRELL